MNIELKSEETKLSTLNDGEMFLYENEVFLRVKNRYAQKSENDMISVVNLKKNEYTMFYDTSVVPVRGELIIELKLSPMDM